MQVVLRAGSTVLFSLAVYEAFMGACGQVVREMGKSKGWGLIPTAGHVMDQT